MEYDFLYVFIDIRDRHGKRNSDYINFFSHIRSLGAAGALAVDICICFHDTKS